MPFCERDPWRFQFFENAACPDDVLIPTDDPDCWEWYPQFRWIYDKLKIAKSQGLACGPHALLPGIFPVFSKPNTNLKGMGVGGKAIYSPAEFRAHSKPGHMWMELCIGPHVSTDCAIIHGRMVWCRHATGLAWKEGTFKHWTIHAEAMPRLQSYIGDWIATHMAGYSGMMNFETIGGKIIETHLRFADQWCDLYGEGWVEALVGLYARQCWDFENRQAIDGFSIPLFARHGSVLNWPNLDEQAAIRAMPHVKSLQITFHESKEVAAHPMPPGGFRLGIVNTTDLSAGLKAREALACCFPDAKIMIPR